MTGFDRRNLIGGLALGGALAAVRAEASPSALAISDLKKDTPIACLYHFDFAEPGRISQMIGNLSNHLAAHGYDPLELKLVVVAHGAGIKPFLEDHDDTPWAKEKPDPDMFARFEALAKFGVEIYLCRMTFERNRIDLAKARTDSFIRLVPSGVATVAALQSKGFAYIKVG